VSVDGNWEVQVRKDPISKQPVCYLRVNPQSVRYAMIDVRGDRVEKGWKSIRALNSAELQYVDADGLRVMKGSTAYYVFERVPEPEKGVFERR